MNGDVTILDGSRDEWVSAWHYEPGFPLPHNRGLPFHEVGGTTVHPYSTVSRQGLDELGAEAIFFSGRSRSDPEVETAERIWGALSAIRQPAPDAEFELRMKEAVVARFLRSIRHGEPLRFIFPGFPAKSPNNETKVLGVYPDMGEELALGRLHQFVMGVRAFYAVGAEISVVSDGCIFAEAVGVADEAVELYLTELRRINPNPSILFVTINDFYPGWSSAHARNEFLNRYAPSVEEVRASLEDEERLRLYNAFQRFRKEDRRPTPGVSRSQLERLVKAEAIQMIRCNDASARFIAAHFPDHIRLSIHPQSRSVTKIGINILPSSHSYSGTPWHGVAVLMADGSIALMKKREAEAAGYELVYQDGRPHHYVQKAAAAAA